MRSLLKRDAHFVWTSDMQKELDIIKKDIANAVKLIHYDPNKPAVIETDASLKGLGAVLIQDGRPVRFLGKALTPSEANYSNIERELLAVLFACEKLHIYTFGRKVTVNTDHKPLQSIFQKPISLAPARLQRMLLRLSKYDIQVKYVGSKRVSGRTCHEGKQSCDSFKHETWNSHSPARCTSRPYLNAPTCKTHCVLAQTTR